MRIGYDFSLDGFSFPPAIILLLSGHHHTDLNHFESALFKCSWHVSFHNQILSLWGLNASKSFCSHACLFRKNPFFSLLINFIFPYSCIFVLTLSRLLLSNIHSPFQEKHAFSYIAAVSTTVRKMNQNQCDCLAFFKFYCFYKYLYHDKNAFWMNTAFQIIFFLILFFIDRHNQ